MLNHPNHYRPISSYTLHIRHHNSILISNTYLPRRKLRLINPIHTCKRSLHIFHLLIPTRRTRYILRILYLHRNLKHRSHPSLCSYSNCIYRLRTPMRTDIFLRRNSNHKPFISHPIHRNYPSRMNLRRLLSRQSYLNTIFRISFHPPIHHCSPRNCPPLISP